MTSKPLKPWLTTASETVHRTPWIEVKADTCIAGGTELTYTYTKRVDEGPMIIAKEDDGSIWLVQQYRHPIKKIIWQLPAEGKHPEESWQEAAERGLAEELQLQAAEWSNLGEFHPDPGGLEQKYHLFLARELSPSSQQIEHESHSEVENLRTQKFTRDEIDQMITNGEICDNWTLAGLYLLDRLS